jgi:pimeloyl-ACP methyl ester carboxylesterase
MRRAIVAFATICAAACAAGKPAPQGEAVSEKINGLQFVEAGSGGVPVLFLHGLCGEARTWRAQMDHLRTARRVAAYDQRGQGASDRAEHYGIDLLTDDLENVVAQLRLGKFWLVGHSMAGAVLSTYAGRHPDRHAGLVFVDAVGDFSAAPPEVKKWFADPGPAFGVPQMQELFGQMLGDKARPQTREEVIAVAGRCDPRAFVQLREDLAARPLAPSLAKFAGPRFAIEGAGPDNPFLASKLPGVLRREVAGVSHWLMLDDPAALNAALDEVLAP